MQKRSVAEIIVAELDRANVEFVFGVPGGGVDPFVPPLTKAKAKYVLTRHEEGAALMASGYAKHTGRLGACFSSDGPGAIHLLNGLYDAKLDRAPVLAITGQIDSARLGTDSPQEVNLLSLFQDVADYNQMVTNPTNAARMIRRAIQSALSNRSVSHLCVPLDVWRIEAEVEEGPHASAPPILVEAKMTEGDVAPAASILNTASRIVILVGRGGRGCQDLVQSLTEKLPAVVMTTYPGKGVVPDGSGNIGIIGIWSAKVREVMNRADCVLLVGTTFPYSHMIPPAAKIIQIDRDPVELGKRFKIDVGLVGEARDILSGILAKVKPRAEKSWRTESESSLADRLKLVEQKRQDSSAPIKPYHLVSILEKLLKDDAVLCLDAGLATVFVVSGLSFKQQSVLVSGRLGSMGFAVPASIAVKMAEPNRQVVAIAGDGGFSMTMAEFMTMAKYNVPVTVLVLDNSTLASVRFEIDRLGSEQFDISLVNADYAKFAESCGGVGYRVTDPGDIVKSLTAALSSGKPSLVHVVVDDQPNAVRD